MSTAKSDAIDEGLVVAALYKFVAIEDPAALRDELAELCGKLNLLGTVLLANEGINATLAGRAADESVLDACHEVAHRLEHRSDVVHAWLVSPDTVFRFRSQCRV